MTEEQYLEYLLIKRLPATCIHNTPRNARRIFTSDFRRMRKTRRYRLFLALAAILVCNVYVDRSCWMVERSNVCFEMVERAFTDKEWYDNFRVSKETFEYIVYCIHSHLLEEKSSYCVILLGFYCGIQDNSKFVRCFLIICLSLYKGSFQSHNKKA